MDPIGSTHWLTLRLDASSVSAARHYVQDRCTQNGCTPDLCDTAVLLTSEVVTNAFIHGRSDTELLIQIRPGLVHIEVSDDNPRHPLPAEADPDALDGRGIAILELLAHTWGVRDEPLGKTVWFDLTEPSQTWRG